LKPNNNPYWASVTGKLQCWCAYHNI
jgi:hypothetical protein